MSERTALTELVQVFKVTLRAAADEFTAVEFSRLNDLYEPARAELAQLRARAAEADALRAERDEWRNAMQHLTPIGSEYLTIKECTVYIENKMGRDIPKRIIEAEKTASELRATVAEQAKAIEAARKIVIAVGSSDDDDKVCEIRVKRDVNSSWWVRSACIAWLAANAPKTESAETPEHVCGLQGFGANDTCDACEEMMRKTNGSEKAS